MAFCIFLFATSKKNIAFVLMHKNVHCVMPKRAFGYFRCNKANTSQYTISHLANMQIDIINLMNFE